MPVKVEQINEYLFSDTVMLRLLSKSLKYRVKSSGLASSNRSPPSPLVSDLISTSGQPDIDLPHP